MVYLRKVVTLLIIAIILNTYTFAFANELSLDGQGSILMDFDTKEILYEKNMDMQLYPASTTKIMTAILAIENANLSDIVTVDQESINLTEGSHIALEPGERLTMEQLLYALLVQSANDAAYVIAKHISGSHEAFANLMNQKAKELGATNTHFVNPNGLHEDEHVTTAYDLAIIAQYAMQNESFRKFVNTLTYTIEPTNIKAEPRYLKNTNKLLFSTEAINVDGKYIPAKYEGASGVKTGTTGRALNCLVSFAEKDGQRLLAVVLKANGINVYSDTHKLLNYGFNNFSNTIIGYKNEFVENIKVENGIQGFVAGIIDNDFIYPLSNENINKIQEKITIRENLAAPISSGEILGTKEYYLEDKLIGKANIVSTMDIEIDPATTLSHKLLSRWYIFVFAFLIIIRIMVLQGKRKRRTRRSYRMPYMN